MQKRFFFQTLLVTLLLTVLIVVLFGSFISAKLSTLPGLRKFHFLSPQAPIVINRKEEVRVSDSGDVQQAISKVKSKLASVLMRDAKGVSLLGNSLTLTSDGLFLTTKTALGTTPKTSLLVLTDSGDPVAVDQIIPDPASNLVFLKANFNNLPVVDFAGSKDLVVGQKLVYIAHGTLAFNPEVQAGYVTVSQRDVFGAQFHAGLPTRAFGGVSSGPLSPGQAVVSIDGFVVGLWDGSSIVSSDVIRDTMDLYFANNNNITRPLFGFDYSLVGKTQSGILDVSSGAQVTKLVKKDSSGHAMPGQAAGLLEGDIITQVGNNKISEDNGLEEALSKVKPGDLVSFTVERNKQVLVFTLTAGTLK